MSATQDQTITCADCGRQFLFSAREQEFFRERGYTPPQRCKECREARKAREANRTLDATRRPR